MSYLKMSDLNLMNQRVLIREDFNVPMQDGKITDDTRLRFALPTIQLALSKGARVMLMSHLGRPQEGIIDSQFSLAPVAQLLSDLLQKPVCLEKNIFNEIIISPDEIVLLENVRFLKGENACDETLSKKLGSLCDVFVMDAFATAHRVQASTVGVAQYAPKSCAGLLLDAELTALNRALTHPKKPVAAIVGGSKVSTKIQALDILLDTVDTLIVGGGIANTCLKAAGYPIGRSLYEKDWVITASLLMQKAKEKQVNMPLPVDVTVGLEFSAYTTPVIKSVESVAPNDMILDVGYKTAKSYAEIMKNARTIVWNGPVGVFEWDAFSKGTTALARAIAESDAYSVAGGGDTVAAISQLNLQDKISYISTGGGAFLEWMEKKSLPAVAILEQREKTYASCR